MPCPLCSSTDHKLRHRVKEYAYLTCQSCGVSVLSPFPQPEEIKAWYADQTYFSLEDGNQGYTDYLSLESGLQRTFARRNKFLGSASFWKGKKILEIGCALGFYPEVLRDIPDMEYTGLDLNTHAINVVREKGFRGIQGDIENIPEKNHYDITVFFDVLEHIPDPFAFFASIQQRMNTEGHILFTTPSTKSFLAGISGKNWVSYIVPHHLLLYEPSSLKRLLAACGFNTIKIAPDIQWVPLSFLNERLSHLIGSLKGLTPHLIKMENAGRKILVPVSNGQMLVRAKKNSEHPINSAATARRNFSC
jgi:2-polyprenyl-3-methyl-5-hydroxy-6-metoxy-1,4-benzoquinol methylase